MGMLLRRHRRPAETPAEPVQDKPLDEQTKAELQDEARKRELSTQGNKAELLERVKAHDAAQAEPTEPTGDPEGDNPEGEPAEPTAPADEDEGDADQG